MHAGHAAFWAPWAQPASLKILVGRRDCNQPSHDLYASTHLACSATLPCWDSKRWLCAPMAFAVRRLRAPSVRNGIGQVVVLFETQHDTQECRGVLSISQRPQVSYTSLLSRLYSQPHVTWLLLPRPAGAFVEAPQRGYAKSKKQGMHLVCAVARVLNPQ